MLIQVMTTRLRLRLCACGVAALVSGATGTQADMPQQSPAPAQPGQPSGRWTPRAAMPTPRLDAVAVAHGGSIYVIGGIGRSGGGDGTPDIRAVEEYDPVTDRWRKRQPAPLRAHAAVSVGNRVFVLGRTALFEFNPARDEWRARWEWQARHGLEAEVETRIAAAVVVKTELNGEPGAERTINL